MYKESIYNCYVKKINGYFVFNSFTKSLIEIDDRDFIKKVLNDKKSDYFEVLYNQGFIVDSDISEKNVLNYIYTKKYFDRESQALIIMPTLDCNFSCPYCFEKGIKLTEQKKYFEIVLKCIEMNKNNLIYIF